MIARGVTLPAAVEMLKGSLVKVAAQEFGLDGAAPTDTRISLLTGVHRKDVRRLRQGTRRAKSAGPASLNVLSELVTRWASDRRYRARGGGPRPLPRSAAAGAGASFADLAYGISSDLKPRPILDELLRLGMVEVDARDRVHLKVQSFVPPQSGEEREFFFGENAGDHLAAGVHNLLEGSPPFLDQAVYSDDLSPESVNEMLHLSREQWSEALRALVRRAAELEAKDKAAGRATERLNVGMYFFAEKRPGEGES